MGDFFDIFEHGDPFPELLFVGAAFSVFEAGGPPKRPTTKSQTLSRSDWGRDGFRTAAILDGLPVRIFLLFGFFAT